MRISATGTDGAGAQARSVPDSVAARPPELPEALAFRREPRAGSRGFTLIELIVALAVASLMLAMIPVAMGKALDAMRYRALVREVVGDLRMARNHAMLAGQPVRYVIDLPARRLGVAENLREIPEGLEVDAVVASAGIDQPGRGAILFYPDGSSTGGSIAILRSAAGSGVRVRVDWLLGRVTQEPHGAPA